MTRWKVVVPAASLVLTGCLASKGDIRLLQEEFRATRRQIGLVDTSLARTNEQRRQQISTLAAQVDRLTALLERTNDSLRVLASRFSQFQGTAAGELDLLSRQMVQVQALLGQTTRSLQETRALAEQLSSGAAAPPAAPSGASPAAASGAPGAATLFTAGRNALDEGAYATARRNFDQLLTTYPDAVEAPRAMYYVGEAYAAEGNRAAADSVYQRVASQYPKTETAADALYKYARSLMNANRNADARTILERIIREYPNSDAARLAADLVKTIR